MKASPSLYAHIRDAEAFRSVAYPDQGGVWTLGFGRTAGIKQGMTCTRAEALAWLNNDVAIAEQIVNRAITRVLTQFQFDACVMFAFNTGTMGKTLASLLNIGRDAQAMIAWADWNHYTNKQGQKVVSHGLVARRADEIQLFRS